MKLLRTALATTALILATSSVFAQNSVSYPIYQCKVIDQSGTQDSWACRDSEAGRIRCYADIEIVEVGVKTRVWGGCAGSFSDCWWNGNSRVDACN